MRTPFHKIQINRLEKKFPHYKLQQLLLAAIETLRTGKTADNTYIGDGEVIMTARPVLGDKERVILTEDDAKLMLRIATTTENFECDHLFSESRLPIHFEVWRLMSEMDA